MFLIYKVVLSAFAENHVRPTPKLEERRRVLQRASALFSRMDNLPTKTNTS